MDPALVKTKITKTPECLESSFLGQVIFHSPAPEAKATAKILKKTFGKVRGCLQSWGRFGKNGNIMRYIPEILTWISKINVYQILYRSFFFSCPAFFAIFCIIC